MSKNQDNTMILIVLLFFIIFYFNSNKENFTVSGHCPNPDCSNLGLRDVLGSPCKVCSCADLQLLKTTGPCGNEAPECIKSTEAYQACSSSDSDHRLGAGGGISEAKKLAMQVDYGNKWSNETVPKIFNVIAGKTKKQSDEEVNTEIDKDLGF